MTLVKEAGFAVFGERWAKEAGYASLILDYRGFGDSEGLPRNFASLEKQYQAELDRANGEGGEMQATVQVLPTLNAQGQLYDVGLGKDDGQILPGNRKKKEKVCVTSSWQDVYVYIVTAGRDARSKDGRTGQDQC